MARRDSLALLLIAALGAATAASGVIALTRLAGAYRIEDVALSESPASFRAWLSTLAGSETAEAAPGRIADRLLAMPLPARRDVVLATGSLSYWSALAPDRAAQRPFKAMLLAGTEGALRRAPASGDLWLLAARLRTGLAGFDAAAARYLAASRSFAPRETEIVAERLALSALVWPLLDEAQRAGAARDMGVLSRALPAQAAAVRSELEAAGVTLPQP